MGCSVDSHFSHLKWKEIDTNNGGIGNVGYPLISDITKSISRSYDVLLGTKDAYIETGEEAETTTVGGGVSLRGSFLIDEDGKLLKIGETQNLTSRFYKGYRCISNT